MNLHYIRAAIEKHTGVHLTLKKTLKYLDSENMITKHQKDTAFFTGYTKYADSDDVGTIKEDEDEDLLLDEEFEEL